MSEKLDNVDTKWFRAEISKKDLKLLSKKSDLKGLQHVTLYFILLFLLMFLMQMYQITAPSRAWNEAVQEQLNDASLAHVINKIFGRRVDFDKWLNSHEISSQRVFGSKVSLQRLRQVGSVLISGVLIVIYFVMREELRNLI